MGLELTPEVIGILGVAAFLIGLAKGGLAGGLGPFITILVSLVVPPARAIGVLLPMLMVGDLMAVGVHRGGWSRPHLLALLPGAALGVAVASLYLGTVSDRAVSLTLAAVSLVFVAHRLRVRRQPSTGPSEAHDPGRALAVGAGVTAGLTSTVAHAGGPPVVMYLLSARLQPVTFAATSAALFLIVNALKVPGYLAAGILDASMLRVLPLTVLILPGSILGRWLVQRIDLRRFELVILVLLTLGAIDLARP